jgi:hypothetical protein
MARADVIKAICEMAIVSDYLTRAPMTELLKMSGYYEEAQPPSEIEFADYIRQHPELIEHWHLFSGDQRYVPAWCLQKPGESGTRYWQVFRFPDIPATLYHDGIRACAAYIARNVYQFDQLIQNEAAKLLQPPRKRRRRNQPVPAFEPVRVHTDWGSFDTLAKIPLKDGESLRLRFVSGVERVEQISVVKTVTQADDRGRTRDWPITKAFVRLRVHGSHVWIRLEGSEILCERVDPLDGERESTVVISV